MSEALDQLLHYDVWANRETLSFLQEGSAPPRSVRWMSHIIGAEFLWLDRIAGQRASLPVWPELSLPESEHRLEQLSGLLLAAARPTDRQRTVQYTNSKGEPWSSTVEEILTHITIHSAYHRGQIASDMRAAGLEPAYTDYIHAVRQRLIQ